MSWKTLQEAVGFLIFARSHTDVTPQRLYVADWEIAEFDEALTVEWLSAAYARMLELAKECRSLQEPHICIEEDDFGLAAFELCLHHFYSTGVTIGLSKIQRGRGESIPTLEQRLEASRVKLNSGTVKIAKQAHERQTAFRSSNNNHFLTQVLTFRPEARDTPAELVTALCIGIDNWSGVG